MSSQDHCPLSSRQGCSQLVRNLPLFAMQSSGETGSAKANVMVCRKVKPSYMSFCNRYSHMESSDSEEEAPGAEEVVMEAQWKSYVDKLRQSGQLSSCLAVADVSGSMSGEPMNVSSSVFHARLLSAWQCSQTVVGYLSAPAMVHHVTPSVKWAHFPVRP